MTDQLEKSIAGLEKTENNKVMKNHGSQRVLTAHKHNLIGSLKPFCLWEVWLSTESGNWDTGHTRLENMG